MNKDIMITVLPGEETDEVLIKRAAAAQLAVQPDAITALVFRKKSVDARRGAIKIHLRYTAWIGEQPPESAEPEHAFVPCWKPADPRRRIVIVGSGPAGLFAALRLLEKGITPVIVERGPDTTARKRDIAAISREQVVNPDSNYCFGEGGAGTFSDGKLYTRSNKRGDIGRILALFHHHGAAADILTDAHPHIGTDRLPAIINAMRETIRRFGGEIRFNTRCTGFMLRNGRAAGITVADADTEIPADGVILAAGHSARDIYRALAQPGTAAPLLEAKGFAAGVRVEHPRELIDRIQYHGRERGGVLPAATYQLTAQADGRGVYSFCMCPGGLVVPSATADDEIVVNGMSPSGRNSRWSNAAVVVELRPEDIPNEFAREFPALKGMRFQEWLEHEAKKHGSGQAAPAQRLEDFLAGRDSANLPPSSYTPGLVPSRLDQWLPPFLADRLKTGFADFGQKLRGFIGPEAVIIAVETRTSAPVRILRDRETCESSGLPGLFPAGEGSGYAGGIVSSAMDGERCADAAARMLYGGQESR